MQSAPGCLEEGTVHLTQDVIFKLDVDLSRDSLPGQKGARHFGQRTEEKQGHRGQRMQGTVSSLTCLGYKWFGDRR